MTLYFWRKNIIGMHESSQKALRIMQLTTVMVVILIIWCIITILQRGYSPVPFPTLENIHFSDDAVGWLKGTLGHQDYSSLRILIGLGHSVLAMSGEESLAQVNREIASPKLKNLKTRRIRDFRLQPGVHLAGLVFRRDAHPGQGTRRASTSIISSADWR